MPLLMSRKQSPEAEASSSTASFRTRSSTSHRAGSSQRQAELRARYEMAQAIQKPWPLHLLENGVKPNSTSAPNVSSSSSRSTRSSTTTAHHRAGSSSGSTRTSARREARTSPAPASLAATHAELASLELDGARSSKKKRNSANSLDKLSLSPTLVSNWIRRASKDSDKSARSSSPPTSSQGSSPINSPKDL